MACGCGPLRLPTSHTPRVPPSSQGTSAHPEAEGAAAWLGRAAAAARPAAAAPPIPIWIWMISTRRGVAKVNFLSHKMGGACAHG
jgi:hypothetical protein